MNKVTCEQALADARAALEDDKGATPGPWFRDHNGILKLLVDGNGYQFGQIDDDGNRGFVINARTREPRLAEWVRGVLEAGGPITTDEVDAVEAFLRRINWTPSVKRATAAALLRAADEAER